MSILFDETKKIFHLQTRNVSYIFQILQNGYPVHLYYGKKIREVGELETVIDLKTCTSFSPQLTSYFGPDKTVGEENGHLEILPLEYAFYGHPDMRTPSFHAQYQDGSSITSAIYDGYQIYKGKKSLFGLPASYVETESEADTLELYLKDHVTQLTITLQYPVFPDYDVICRSALIQNRGDKIIDLRSVMSLSLDLPGKDYTMVHLSGGYARERYLHKKPLDNGFQGVDSKRGASSHAHNPFLALAELGASEEHGNVYGFSLIYSGNFIAEVYVDQHDFSRVLLGINPFDFNWRLEPGENFQTPEAVAVFSSHGYGEMSRRFHRFYRQRLCRGIYRDAQRPILINSWEATYFDFDQEKILNLARTAKKCGIEMMVLDDGWFGKRDDDTCSLGDWVANTKKLPNGIPGIAKEVHELGMKFGLWFEPEMVSHDSNLFRAHPDWCLHVPNRNPSMSRHQLILDLSREDVRNYIVETVSAILTDGSVDYVKWDMNRNLSEIGSVLQTPERQRETAHRYILGLYEVLETITSRFPQILFESCSGGGGRFDPGMLYYMPQTWTSDNTDPLERLFIQYGTSMVYPTVAMGAHVSSPVNHYLKRTTSLFIRGDLAMAGQFGYELDLGLLTPEELNIVTEQVERYKTLRDVFHLGQLYRLRSPFEGNHMVMEYVSEDEKTVVLCCYSILGHSNPITQRIRLMGLDAKKTYILQSTGQEFGGDRLMNLGILYKDIYDFDSQMLVFLQK